MTIDKTVITWGAVTLLTSSLLLLFDALATPRSSAPVHVYIVGPYSIRKLLGFTSLDGFLHPIGSMYAIYGNIYHQYTPVMLENTPVMLENIPAPWIRHGHVSTRLGSYGDFAKMAWASARHF
jgi:hypothetical protein